jgi:hypothetical protein
MSWLESMGMQLRVHGNGQERTLSRATRVVRGVRDASFKFMEREIWLSRR